VGREGSGEVPSLPRKIFAFGSQNGEIWCILGHIFTVELLMLTHTAFIHQLTSAMQSVSLILQDKPNE